MLQYAVVAGLPSTANLFILSFDNNKDTVGKIESEVGAYGRLDARGSDANLQVYLKARGVTEKFGFLDYYFFWAARQEGDVIHLDWSETIGRVYMSIPKMKLVFDDSSGQFRYEQLGRKLIRLPQYLVKAAIKATPDQRKVSRYVRFAAEKLINGELRKETPVDWELVPYAFHI